MSEFFFSIALDETRKLCVAPLTDQCIADSGQQIDDPSGYFLFEKRAVGSHSEVVILAQATSEEAAFTLRGLLQMT